MKVMNFMSMEVWLKKVRPKKEQTSVLDQKFN